MRKKGLLAAGCMVIVLCAAGLLYRMSSSDKNITRVTITIQPGGRTHEMTDQREIATFTEGIRALDLEETSEDPGERSGGCQVYDIEYENGKTAQYYYTGNYFGEGKQGKIKWYAVKEESK